MKMRLAFFLFFLACTFPVKSDQVIDLGGFRLWQLKSAVDSFFEKPFQEFETNEAYVKAYLVDTDAYMVFEYLKKYPENISSIQLTGKTDKDLRFKDLRLGDKKETVIKSLGNPTSVTPIDDPKVFRYSYENSNYSIELDENNKLYSIRIDISRKIMEPPETSIHWEEFVSAVKSKNVERILEILRPDFEVYLEKDVISIKTRYLDFQLSPDKQFKDVFLDTHLGVLAGIEETEPERELRVTDNMGIGFVYKFYKGSILKEIVFFPYNGEYRVYEIAFKPNKRA